MRELEAARTAWLARLDGTETSAERIADALPAGWRARGGLSGPEAELVVLAALAVLDGTVAAACGQARGCLEEPWPTLSLAMRLIPGLSWAHVVSTGAARAAGLVAVDPDVPMRSRLRCPERVWAALTGTRVPDPTLANIAGPGPRSSVALHHDAPPADTLKSRDVVLVGSDRETLVPAAAAFVAQAGQSLLRVRADLLPENVVPIVVAIRREQVLEGAVCVVDLLDASDAHRVRAWRLVRGVWGSVVRLERSPVAMGERSFVPWLVAAPSLLERTEGWRTDLAPLSLPDDQREAAALRLADAFRLSADARHTTVAHAKGAPDPLASVWSAAAAHSVRPPGRLVHVHTASTVGWGGLVVEDDVQSALRALVNAALDRARVMSAWGMAVGRAGGLTALFTGPSGTGKTLAAEVVASELGLALWRIDLSMVVSKYIGETEKHLGAVFDAAEGSGAVLLFDEADALFAQRSDVSDSRDRYANLEVGFLLQRIESFGGLAILTTNLEDQLDAAFQRRLFTVVRFGFPARERRAALWARVFPPAVPTSGLDVDRLAQVQLTGAGIRAVATRAAFLATAGEGSPVVTMAILAEAVRTWMHQQRRALSARELEGWD